LAGLIHQVSRGNFNVSARKVVKSKDEVGDLANAFDKMTDGLKERDKVKNLFNKFHGSSIAEEMMHGEIGVKGTSKEVVVFFSDIRGFTKFSEGHTPEQVVSMLNEYFAVMVSIITKNHGVVDKFIGDAIMAIWGAPKSTGNDQYNAVKACLEMRVALAELNTKRIARGESAIMIGMGVHSGPAMSGTIGSEDRMEYTVIGDTVNMSSRIESSTKAFGTDLLLSETLAGAIDGKFELDLAGSAEVKGKAEPLKLFKVAGYKSANGEIIKIKTPYSEYHAEHADKVKVS
jgi:adenylate cyclase